MNQSPQTLDFARVWGLSYLLWHYRGIEALNYQIF